MLKVAKMAQQLSEEEFSRLQVRWNLAVDGDWCSCQAWSGRFSSCRPSWSSCGRKTISYESAARNWKEVRLVVRVLEYSVVTRCHWYDTPIMMAVHTLAKFAIKSKQGTFGAAVLLMVLWWCPSYGGQHFLLRSAGWEGCVAVNIERRKLVCLASHLSRWAHTSCRNSCPVMLWLLLPVLLLLKCRSGGQTLQTCHTSYIKRSWH